MTLKKISLLIFLIVQGSSYATQKTLSDPSTLKAVGFGCLAIGAFNTVIPIGHILVSNGFCLSCISSKVATACCMGCGFLCFGCGGKMIDESEKKMVKLSLIEKELTNIKKRQKLISVSDTEWK